MPTIVTGNPANVNPSPAATIVGCTSAGGVIKVQTSAPHLYSTNDFVEIVGVLGTTEANSSPLNPWQITVVDATHFTLNGSTFVHAYTSGGAAFDLSLTPAVQIPNGGEPVVAGSVGAPIQALLDRTQWLTQKLICQSYRFINVLSQANSGAVIGGSPWTSGLTVTFPSTQQGDLIVAYSSLYILVPTNVHVSTQLMGSENGGGTVAMIGGFAEVGDGIGSVFAFNTAFTFNSIGIHTVSLTGGGTYAITNVATFGGGGTPTSYSTNSMIAFQFRTGGL